ncbi:MAG: FMN-binding protein [Dehalococcoidia bacterium]|nr:Electron transport complex subunit RsxG [Chloroflexota bacterium]MBT9161711.1 Electron transport complex subunit RsxG [Chloroflexota bacterium]
MRRTLLLSLVALVILGVAAACPAPVVVAPEPIYTYKDGVFEAVSDSVRGYAWVRLFIARDEILHVDIVEYDGMGMAKDLDIYSGDRFTLLPAALEALTTRIVAANTWDVEVFTGATATSNKVRQAAQRALEKALVAPPPDVGKYFDGTFMGKSDVTFRGWHFALVTIENDTIVAIKLEGTTPLRDEARAIILDAKNRGTWVVKGADYPWEPYLEAKVVIAERMLEAQNHEVDIFTGATGSSLGWMQAVQRALETALR